MAFTGSFISTSFKQELMLGAHSFGATTLGTARSTSSVSDTFKIALYTNLATLDATTTVYTAPASGSANPTSTNEVTSTGTAYTTGGNTLTTTGTNAAVPTISGTFAYISFVDTTWAASTITARGALIYNSSQTNRAVCTLDFGSDKTSTSGAFTISFPLISTPANAILRIT
jgi:hypothetical protein